MSQVQLCLIKPNGNATYWQSSQHQNFGDLADEDAPSHQGSTFRSQFDRHIKIEAPKLKIIMRKTYVDFNHPS